MAKEVLSLGKDVKNLTNKELNTTIKSLRQKDDKGPLPTKKSDMMTFLRSGRRDQLMYMNMIVIMLTIGTQIRLSFQVCTNDVTCSSYSKI